MLKLTKEVFIQKAISVHNDNYDYSQSEYINYRTKLNILCNSCNNIFVQDPHSHLKGKGCPLCGKQKQKENINKANVLSITNRKNAFIKNANTIHGNKYSYNDIEYVNNSHKINIFCLKCNAYFKQTPTAHLDGSGCQQCAINKRHEYFGWTKTHFINACIRNNNGLGKLYIIKCFNQDEEFYKIGITSRSIGVRFGTNKRMPYKFTIIREIVDEPDKIFELEKHLHKLNKEFHYHPLIKFDGSHFECFSKVLDAQ